MGIEDFQIEKLQNPDLNIKIGTWYLSSLLREFDNNTILALAAYNGGRGNVAKWLAQGRMQQNEDDIPFPETRNFVMRVKRSYKWYRRLYNL
jgi:soluble lytic murein transglycosylase